MIEPPYYPIIYLRGYAGSESEIEDTVSTPYMGFNLGSTRIRQLHTGEVQPHIFESPVIRLMKDYDYVDAYCGGEILPNGPIPSRSIWIFRYYDIVDEDFGESDRKEIEFHARRLGEFLLHVRGAVLEADEEPRTFRAYLVAHSMGGLIARCYLQHPDISYLKDAAKPFHDWRDTGVDKLFTYGTPHGGITFRRGLGWAEGFRDFLDPNNAANFGPKRMRAFLGLPNDTPLNSLNGCYPPQRVFCLVGTDSHDYRATAGLARRAVGPMSDGLVKIKNASVLDSPRAFVYRSHSGYYGLVNSESGYQNMRRFFFGDTRALVEMTDVEVTLPPQLRRRRASGASIRASYHIDTAVTVRGIRVELHRRAYDEGSAMFRTYEQLTTRRTSLFTTFLTRNARVNRRRSSLGFALRLVIRVPEYVVDNRFFDDYYEGGLLFSDKLNIEIMREVNGTRRIRYGWDSRTPNRTSRVLDLSVENEELVASIPFGRRDVQPGISGNIRVTISRWNS